jgi:hypothetical protein
VSRVTPVQTAMRNCTRDEGRPFEFGNQVLISSHRKLLSSKATVVNVAEKSGRDPVKWGRVIAVELGPTGGAGSPKVQRKAAAFARWHEPDDARV